MIDWLLEFYPIVIAAITLAVIGNHVNNVRHLTTDDSDQVTVLKVSIGIVVIILMSILQFIIETE